MDEELREFYYYLSQYDFRIKICFRKRKFEADQKPGFGSTNEDQDEQLKIINSITLDDILTDQENNETIQKHKKNLLYRQNNYKKVKKKQETIILSEEFSIKFIKQIHENICQMGLKQIQKKMENYIQQRI